MSGRRARENRRLQARIDELSEYAQIAEDLAADMQADGDAAGAAEWMAWARALNRGAQPVIDRTTAELELVHRGAVWIDGQERRLVDALRADGVSWQRIGWAVGMTDQGARKKYTRPS